MGREFPGREFIGVFYVPLDLLSPPPPTTTTTTTLPTCFLRRFRRKVRCRDLTSRARVLCFDALDVWSKSNTLYIGPYVFRGGNGGGKRGGEMRRRLHDFIAWHDSGGSRIEHRQRTSKVTVKRHTQAWSVRTSLNATGPRAMLWFDRAI